MTCKNAIRLGVNIDHVATIRNARGEFFPDPVRAAMLAHEAGADGITAHLREDRRHIRDDDIAALMKTISLPLNFEMAATAQMQDIALSHRPHAVCLVPERREERTTEGGLDVVRDQDNLARFIDPLKKANCRVSLFIAPDRDQIAAAHRIGADVVELHTGVYCRHHADFIARQNDPPQYVNELKRLYEGAGYARDLGLEVHAGHGLTYDNVSLIAAMPHISELNIGHFLISEAIFCGLSQAISKMRVLIDAAIDPAIDSGIDPANDAGIDPVAPAIDSAIDPGLTDRATDIAAHSDE